jgi:glycogen debranching enzyme
MERHNQNLPHQYHNGGIWPFIAGFWAILLAQSGRRDMALQELTRYAEACRVNDWEFNEWFHGKTGKPMGMAGQSWNAALYVFAYRVLRDNLTLY